jgi:EAL domain-containing protein (putative c-di-GMP-specific phosphodiesterase class I)
LYQAKDAGRGVARYFSSELQSEQEGRVRLEADLRSALSSKQFYLVYQPLINAKTQKLVGFEALIRWNHPQRGLVPPNVFIPVAEETGLMGAIGEWVIDEACKTAASWPEPITVALNISPKQIILPALPNIVSEALARYRLAGNRIELEVTEGVFLGDNGSTLDVLKRLRALGVGIALDDFGTGYSSIGYLNKAVFHKLKIDGSFVREAGSRPENVAIIQSIVQLAKSFRMSITAEGVETAEDFERMRDLGCDIIQGYLFGKPLPYERANQMVTGLGNKKVAAG